MRLQNFLGTDLTYHFLEIAIDPELATQIQIRLIDLNLLEPPANGLFGPISAAALEEFQRSADCGDEFGYLGPVTAQKLIETKWEEHATASQSYKEPCGGEVCLAVPYKSQLDNFNNPTGTCNVTSIAMCLEFLGVSSTRTQLEDELYEYASSCGLDRHSPQDLAQIVRDYGCCDNFRDDATIEEVQEWLAGGNPAVAHGYFTSFGHIIALVGYTPTGFYVHDPYGEWFPTGYNTCGSGANLHYSYDLIREICMPDGNFWVHFISS